MGRGRNVSITYDAPPVVEVAISVQFEPPPGLNLAHLGIFWERQKAEFPKMVLCPPIPATPDDFVKEGQWLPPSLRLAFINEPLGRLQMTSSDDQWMCQIQVDRLVVNWRKRLGEYPRFGATFERFLLAWTAMKGFLASEGIGTSSPRLWEVAYVNRIPKGELWKAPEDWPTVFPGLWGQPFKSSHGLTLRGLQGQWVWDSAPDQAKLHVVPSPARSSEDPPVELLMLNLTSRGVITPNPRLREETNHDQAIEDGLNLGHDLIVSTFDSIASRQAQEHWRRHD